MMRVLFFVMLLPFHLAGAGLEFQETEGKHLDLISDGKTLVRYMYEYDPSTPESLHQTYKPYLHVFDADGKAPITKGPGGQFTHHRGVFIGWSKIKVNGKTYDRWHMKGGSIVHQKFLKKEIKDGIAAFTSLTHWMDQDGQPFLEEERTISVTGTLEAKQLMIDFKSKLTPTGAEVVLGGDPEHAGIQYRPANEVDRKKTRYLFPDGLTNPRQAKDLRWAGETYSLGDRDYSVVHMNSQKNPKGTVYSAYRDYGRFGAFFSQTIPRGESLTVNYRFLIKEGALPEADRIDRLWKAWNE